MAVVDINPRYFDLLEQHGLASAASFLSLPGPVVSGHPNRNVARVTLTRNGSTPVVCYLKREHRVGRGQRLANAWAGFGFVSNSVREAGTLRHLRQAGVGCPDWVAAGEDDRGRAFLLVRALDHALELREFLRGLTPAGRRRFARRLGEALAHLHDAGFSHPDLCAKHVLVDPGTHAIDILDWQRSRHRPEVSWPHRWVDLAVLDATLADDLAADRDRFACLHGYLQATVPVRVPRAFRNSAVCAVRRHSEKLLRQRRIREQRQTPTALGTQSVVWLNGERLCVTPEFQAALGGEVPPCLAVAPDRPLVQESVAVPGTARAELVRRRSRHLRHWLACFLGRRRFTSPELNRANLLFRLERQGVGTPRLLAFGQWNPRPWITESFLLTEPPDGLSLTDWLRQEHDPSHRWKLVREAGAVLRRIHEAGCQGAGRDGLVVRHWDGPEPAVVLGQVRHLESANSPIGPSQAVGDLRDLRRSLPAACHSRTDDLRFLLSYLGVGRLRAAHREFALLVVGRNPAAPESFPGRAQRNAKLLTLSSCTEPTRERVVS